ncbi:MAG TPA: nucleotidyl transferase AbiEii/AbiGii toxin family protein, partial [Thermoanaerobaculia bacterium]|nr:nucleotidyl transferase AbiEii/AbiGii toxin family protein [Thermoanaerobaculia bacterium]
MLPAEQRFTDALRALAAALGEIRAPSMIIGGIAVIAAGVPRQTIDIDAVVLGRDSSPESLVTSFARYGIVPRIADAVQFARERQVLLLRHEPSGVTIEVSLAWLPFEEEALARANQIEIGGVTLRVATPEDLIVYKAAAWRDRDRADIERLLALHWREIDLERVRSLITEISAALDDSGRIEAFENILARVRSS